jgi:predicted alpha/beta-hydrolase family hydrolase
VTVVELDTPHGTARAHVHPVDAPRVALVLGHGAGGSVTARDLLAATRAANGAGASVALVEQPYRVAGRRSPPLTIGRPASRCSSSRAHATASASRRRAPRGRSPSCAATTG